MIDKESDVTFWDYLEDYKPMFINAKQRELMVSNCKNKTWIGSRGSGKSFIEGLVLHDMMADMPSCRLLLYIRAIKQFKTKEFLEIKKAWSMIGYSEYSNENVMGDYILFTKPPSHFIKTHGYEDYENVISFIDGSCIEIVSEAQMAARGGSYDAGIGLEASLLDRQYFFADIYPMVRGNSDKYRSKWYLSWCFFSNMPNITKGNWIVEQEELAIEFPEQYFYLESNIYDNQDFYGLDYIKHLERTIRPTSPLVWEKEYLNKKDSKLENPFYRYFNLQKHTYTSTTILDKFYNTGAPLIITCDFNNNYFSAIVCQTSGKVLSFQTEYTIITGGDYLAIYDSFHEDFKYHLVKRVLLRGDVDGMNRIDSNGKTLYDNIREKLMAFGWSVEQQVPSVNPEHMVKMYEINKLLNDDTDIKVRINSKSCKNLILSIINTERKDQKKDKRSEGKLKGEDRHRATDLSDAFDYCLMYEKQSMRSTNYQIDFN